MTDLPFTGWMPPPAPARGGRFSRALAALILLLSLLGMVTTLVVWRADAADQRRDFARAVRWRPGVALYHRQYGETLLMASPAGAEVQLLDALRLDPYDPLAMADLTETELALGNWSQAVAVTRREGNLEPSFDDDWRLANLYLTHGDTASFWRETQIACLRAESDYFPTVVARGLTASGNDFSALRRALPAGSVAAASAALAAAVERSNLPEARSAAQWLVSLAPSSDGVAEAARERALMLFFQAAWRQWPADVPGAWATVRRAGYLSQPPKAGGEPYLFDGDFSPALYASLAARVPNPADRLRAILGWGWNAPSGVRFYEVATGEAAHASAAEFQFDGGENDDLELASQWILAAPGILRVQAATRALDGQASAVAAPALSLRLTDQGGKVMGQTPLPVGGAWQTTQGSLTLAGTGIGAFELSLHYHRPAGALPLRRDVLITGIELRGARGQ